MASPRSRRARLTGGLALFVALALLASAAAVDRSKFRTCKDAAFCRRHRDKTTFDEYHLGLDTVSVEGGVLKGVIRGGPARAPPLALEAHFLTSGVARVRVTEATKQEPRWEAPDILLPDALAAHATVASSRTDPGGVVAAARHASGSMPPGESEYVSYTAANGASIVVAFQASPFRVDLFVDGEHRIAANGQGKFHFEHRRSRDGVGAAQDSEAIGGSDETDPNAGKTIVDWGEDGRPIYDDGSVGGDPAAAGGAAAAGGDAAAAGDAASSEEEDGMWEESFGSHRDSKPNGPTSISMDISFPGAANVYGIPEHASSMALKPTDGSSGGYNEPYRLYNLDVFEYELDVPMALYGAIPVVYGHSAGGKTAGAFWNNPTETYIDVTKSASGAAGGWDSRWISESGIVDLMLIPGPAPVDVFGQYAALTGAQALPPRFAIAYHQCRWNYKDEGDVANVDAKFEEHNFPYDVLWLDIEHTDGKRYFTWDNRLFPNPAAMQDKLAERGRKMVTIVDPHIKRDGGYKIHSEAQREKLYVTTKDGGEYDGWCWPGSSSYLDFTDSRVRSWWSDRFLLENYGGSTLNLFTWNDMNEPSVFNGPEVSMPKDALSLAGVEHREWHNLYGFYHHGATAEGLVRRSPGANSRPFVLSRSFYAGSQRHGAIWTGDNAAKWDHLEVAAPMLLSVGLGGLSFAGADVGGFFGNPDAELMTRWYQAGAYQPFFRAHAHIETKRREPWLFGDETLGHLRDAVRARYALLPFWYTQYYHTSRGGSPVMRPLWVEYPTDAATFTMDDQWLVGTDLLVKPITRQGQTSATVYLPGSEPWFDVADYTRFNGGAHINVQAPIDKIPVYQRGGSIVPRQQRPRRCSALMVNDPYTLVVALDNAQKAIGTLYLDDGETFDYQSGAYRLRQFDFGPATSAGAGAGSMELKATTVDNGNKAFAPANTVERVVVLGLARAPTAVTATGADGSQSTVTFTHDVATGALTLRKPGVGVAYDWTITLRF